MKDTLLIRCDTELKDLIDWYAKEVNTNRSNVIRMILYRYIQNKKNDLEEIYTGVMRDDNKHYRSSMMF